MLIQIPSFFCAIQLLRLGQKENPLKLLHNQLLFCLLIVSIWAIAIDLPFTQAYLWLSFVPIQNEWACYFYNMSFFTVTGLNRFLMAFMSVERHFLVFSPQLYRTSRSRLVFHYIPLVFLVLCGILYFLVTNVFLPCPEKSFNYSLFMCGYTCTVLDRHFGLIFIWIIAFLPTVVTSIASLLLPIRFIIQKRTLQRVQWHRTRKMILQTSFIASTYIFFWLSYTIVLQLLFNEIIAFDNTYMNEFFTYGPYATSLLTPFLVQNTVPGWMNRETIARIKRRFFPQRENAIQPRHNLVT